MWVAHTGVLHAGPDLHGWPRQDERFQRALVKRLRLCCAYTFRVCLINVLAVPIKVQPQRTQLI